MVRKKNLCVRNTFLEKVMRACIKTCTTLHIYFINMVMKGNKKKSPRLNTEGKNQEAWNEKTEALHVCKHTLHSRPGPIHTFSARSESHLRGLAAAAGRPVVGLLTAACSPLSIRQPPLCCHSPGGAAAAPSLLVGGGAGLGHHGRARAEAWLWLQQGGLRGRRQRHCCN